MTEPTANDDTAGNAGVSSLTAESFDDTIASSEKPVLVDFWAEWCGPCKMIAPILEEIAAEQDTVTITKLNIEEAPDVARRFDVMSIPTLIVFKDGEPAKMLVGAKGKNQLLEELADFM